jgi:DNA-directed RNA polymerase specialized sigma24 family protein
VGRDEIDRLLANLPPDLRKVFTLRLEGYTNVQIASQIGRTVRNVELKLRLIRKAMYPQAEDGPPTQRD